MEDILTSNLFLTGFKLLISHIRAGKIRQEKEFLVCILIPVERYMDFSVEKSSSIITKKVPAQYVDINTHREDTTISFFPTSPRKEKGGKY